MPGDSSDSAILEQVNAVQAAYLFAVDDNDASNVETTRQIFGLIEGGERKNTQGRFRCFTRPANCQAARVCHYGHGRRLNQL